MTFFVKLRQHVRDCLKMYFNSVCLQDRENESISTHCLKPENKVTKAHNCAFMTIQDSPSLQRRVKYKIVQLSSYFTDTEYLKKLSTKSIAEKNNYFYQTFLVFMMKCLSVWMYRYVLFVWIRKINDKLAHNIFSIFIAPENTCHISDRRCFSAVIRKLLHIKI